jgi:hypothetical protein
MALGDEKKWLRKFYQGTFLVKGWDARMVEILEHAPDSQKAELKRRLSALGAKIGPEWAKDNRHRRIDTVTLQRWGETLREHCENDPQTLSRVIDVIEAEIETILT